MGLFKAFEMNTLGVSLIVGGMAFLVSGLLFLLPTKRKPPQPIESFDESRERTEYYLEMLRKENSKL